MMLGRRLLFALSIPLVLLPVAASQTPAQTRLAVTSAGAPVTSVSRGTAVTLTASVTAIGAPVTRGQVNFCVVAPAPLRCTDIRLLATAQLTGAGTATFTFYPGIGAHVYQAMFAGTHLAGASSANGSLSVNGLIPTTTTISSPTFYGFGAALGTFSLDVTVTGSDGTVTPTGTVSLLDADNSNYVLGTATLVPGMVSQNSNAGYGPDGFGDPIVTVVPKSGLEVAVGDFNGDGKPDVVLGGGSMMLGNGDGTFTSGPAPNDGNPISLAVADFNGDGKLDLAAVNFGPYQPPGAIGVFYPQTVDQTAPGSVMVLMGNGDGTFAATHTLPSTLSPWPTFVATADINGDGIPDLVVTNSHTSTGVATVNVMLGNGDGTFTLKSSNPTGQHPVAVAVGDFNGDGIPDLAVANAYDNPLTILLGNGDGTFRPAPSNPSTGISVDPVDLVVGDFNGDGILDIAVANYGAPGLNDWSVPGMVTVLLGRGDGTFTIASEVYARNHLNSIAVGDFNKDGVPDLAMTDFGGLVGILFGDGHGNFTPAGSFPTVANTNGYPAYVAVGDFNGDGIADVAVGSQGTTNPYLVPIPPPPTLLNVLPAQANSLGGMTTATATISKFFIDGTGTHHVVATYPGDTIYAPSTSGLEELFGEPVPTTLLETAVPASINYGQTVVLSAALTPLTEQNHALTGFVTFAVGSTVLGTGTVAGGGATLSTTLLPAGADTVTATYSGDRDFLLSQSITTVTVNGSQTVTMLTATPNPATPGQSIQLTASVAGVSLPGTPAGTISFYNGTTDVADVPLNASGTAQFSLGPLPLGSYSLTAAYSGAGGFLASQSPPLLLAVSGYNSVTTLAASPNPGGVGQPVTLKATVTGIGAVVSPSGSVSFFLNGATLLGLGTLDASGIATLTTSALPLGTDSLTAAYAGSATFSPGRSAALLETIETPTFTLSLSSPSITLQKYQHTTMTVTLTSAGTFSDTIALSCASPPQYVTCLFTPANAALTANGTASVSLYIDTDSILGGDNYTGPAPAAHARPAAWLLLPWGILAGLTANRRRRWKSSLLAVLAAAWIALAIGGCGGSLVAPVPATQPGTYIITITATGAATGATQSTPLTLVVTPGS
jgi:hypothetical protein